MKSEVVRFLKFGVVGSSGVIVNVAIFQVMLAILADSTTQPVAVFISNAVGVVVSIFTNFMLNDRWTWADRIKGDRNAWWRRLGKYYVSASFAAAVQLGMTQVTLWMLFQHINYEIAGQPIGPTFALLTGIGCGMVINFVASHVWAFKDA